MTIVLAPEPPCTRSRGHQWKPRVSSLVKFCPSCKAELPLCGDGARRARAILALGERDGWFCSYCRVPVVPDSDKGTGGRGVHVSLATIDHVVPLSMGGSNRRENLVLACSWCNHKKGDRDENWLRDQPAFVARRVEVCRQFGPMSTGGDGDAWSHAMDLLDLVASQGLRFGALVQAGPGRHYVSRRNLRSEGRV